MAENVVLKKAREEKNLSLKDLAAAVGEDPETMEALEQGNYNPSLDQCQKISRVLGRDLNELFWDDSQKLPDPEKKFRPVISSKYSFYAEPEAGINDPREFSDALCNWACKEHHDLEILLNSMEPEVIVDGVQYVCRLGEPAASPVENMLLKKLKLPMINHSFGRCLGYKWIYFYQVDTAE